MFESFSNVPGRELWTVILNSSGWVEIGRTFMMRRRVSNEMHDRYWDGAQRRVITGSEKLPLLNK